MTKTSDTFNILDTIDPNDPLAIDICNDIAETRVVQTSDEKEPHFSDSADAWIAAFLAMIVHYGGTQGTRSRQTIREMLSSPERIAMAIKVMKESTAWNGMLSRMSAIRLLSIKDLCVLARISRRAVYRIRVAGQLPASIHIGGRMRCRPEDIERWLQAREPASPASAGQGGVLMNTEELRRLAGRLGRGCRRVIQNCLRKEEWSDADEEFARIIFNGLNQRRISTEGGDGGRAAEQLDLNDLRADRKR